MIGECKLCRNRKGLQRKCHVIPDFLYRESNLYQEPHNLVLLDLKKLLKNGEKRILSNRQQTGDYDTYQFCKDCDGAVISNHESYARDFFFAKQLPKNKQYNIVQNNQYIEAKNVDYCHIKLFCLSILWRASISNRSLFSEISLNENISERIRKMILLNNPKTDITFPVFFMTTLSDWTTPHDYLFQPIQMQVGDEDGFMFAIGGMIMIFSEGIKGIPESILKYRIHENGDFRALKVPPGEMWQMIYEWYGK